MKSTPIQPFSLFVIVVVFSAGCSSSKNRDAPEVRLREEIRIFASSDTQGWIEPCGCASGQSGGMSRRATLIEQLSGDRESLLVSVGGATLGSSPYDVEKLRAIVAGEAAMGYAVHNLGLPELQIGIDRIGGAAEEMVFVSTNTAHPDSLSARRSVVVTRGGWDLLVMGVIQPGLAAGTVIDDPETAILQELAANPKPRDAVIVLAYMDADALRDLAEQLPEVDVILGGMVEQSVAPKLVGQTMLTAVGNKGKFIARVTGTPSNADKLRWSADLHEVTDSLSEDPTQQANLKAFRERLAELDFSAFETSFVSDQVITADLESRFVGSAACAQCHREDSELWQQSAHSHAWKTLEDVGAHVDSDCQRCHTTGYGMSDGFLSRSKSMDRIDVGCESCHGPSSAHVNDPESKTPWQAAESCRVCHDHENSPQFEYDAYWEPIVHGKAPAVVKPIEAKPEVKTEPEEKSEPEPESESELKAVPEPDVQPATEPIAVIEPGTESESPPQPKIESDASAEGADNTGADPADDSEATDEAKETENANDR